MLPISHITADIINNNCLLSSVYKLPI